MKKIVIGIVSLCVLVIAIMYLALLGSFPVMQGSLKIAGLDSRTQIYRDQEGIVHIDAQTAHDMNFALGFSMASDRAFQYEMVSRAGQGKLSELLGPDLLPVDKLFRTLNSAHIRNNILSNIDAKIRKDLDSFMAGYNYYLENNIRPIEFFILGTKPKKIEIEDIYGVFVYLTYSFSPFIRNEIAYNDILAKVKNRNLEYLFANDNVDLSKKVRRVVESSIIDYDSLLKGIGTFTGSNAWAIAGKNTKSGKPILASDPHIQYSAPNIWYEANIRNKQEDFHIYGHFLPLLPFAAMGHNRHHGWGLTVTYTDDVDLYQMPDDFEVVREEDSTIFVKGQGPVDFTLRWSKKGPIVDEIATRVDSDAKNIAAFFSFFQEGNKPIEGFYRLGRAKSFEEIKQAAALVKSPGQNIIYADVDGNVARLIMGDSYKRSHPKESDLIQAPDRKILGPYDFMQKPHEINPRSGYVVSANDRPKVKTAQDVHHRGGWHSDNRYDTILSALELRHDWDLAAQKMVQTASFSSNNKKMVDLIIKSALRTKLSEQEQSALTELKDWSGHSRADLVGPAIFHETTLEIRKLLMDELEDDRLNYCKAINSWTFYYRLVENPYDFWWDIKNTAPIENMYDIMAQAFKLTVAKYTKELGADIKTWKWGRVHQLKLPHAFEKSALLSKIFSHGPYPANGSINSINHIRRVKCDQGHTPVTGPSTRRLVDFSNVDISYGILPLGNSGHMLSPFYDNQRERFLNDEYREQIFNFDLVKKREAKYLTLRPLKSI